MSDTYWPTDVDRIEVRILIPMSDGTEDPQELAQQINDAVGEHALRLTTLPFWYVAELKGPDHGLFDPPEPPLRLVGEISDDQ